MLSLYLPGVSGIHRLPAGLKLAAVAALGTTVMLIPVWPVLAAILLVITSLYAVAHIPARHIARLARNVAMLALVIIALQWWLATATAGVTLSLRLASLIFAANLMTLTTPLSSLIATVETLVKPLSRLGVRPDRIGIAVGLTLNFIPLLSEQGARIREAQSARGVRAPFTFLVPLIISTVRLADGVGEALEVRTAGQGDPA